MKRIIVSALALIIIAAAAVSVYLWWTKQKAVTPHETETEIALRDNALGEIPETTEPIGAIQPVMPAEGTTASTEQPLMPAEEGTTASTEQLVVPVEDSPESTDVSTGEITIPIDLSTDQTSPEIPVLETETTTRSVAIPSETGSQRETRPTTTSGSERPQVPETASEVTIGTIPTTEVVETSPLGLVEATPTPISTQDPTKPDATPTPVSEVTPTPTASVATPTPGPVPTTPVVTPTPGPAAGRFSVVTLTPVLETQLQNVRKAMRQLGVQLQEQRIGQQRLQAYRVALGYFRLKSDAASWAQTHLRPKGLEYFVYPAQGMYSIQLGVFTQQQSVDQKMQELYQKFPGWRLPLRTEMVNIPTFHYRLSIQGITESLARKIQDTLFRMKIQAELTGR